MKFTISKRLTAIADEVPSGSVVMDVGTDHGLLPVYLVKAGKINKAIASDVNIEPLKKAERNVMLNHLENNIDLRLGYGLSAINKNEADVLVLSGMGGMLIIDILKNGADIVKQAGRLILQPQLDIDKVRKYVHKIGFKIENEIMVFEDAKFYTVINAVKGNEVYELNEYYLFGYRLIEKKCPVLKHYLEYRLNECYKILYKLKLNNTENSLSKAEELKHDIDRITRVIMWL